MFDLFLYTLEIFFLKKIIREEKYGTFPQSYTNNCRIKLKVDFFLLSVFAFIMNKEDFITVNFLHDLNVH